MNVSLLIYFYVIFIVNNRVRGHDSVNDYPVVGVLAQEISYHLNLKYPGQYSSYIASSYVKFLEGAGARVVPIWIDKPRSYYVGLMTKLSGILFPGGATWFNQTNGYAEAGRHIYDTAIEMNKNGTYFPLWGTCLGFELLTFLSADGEEHRTHCNSMSQSLPLVFKPDYKTSRLFKNAPNEIVKVLEEEAVTSNFHQFCTTEKNLTDYNLTKEWTVMSVNNDWNGLEFVSTIENKKWPFFGVQFHPEKNIYEWVQNRNISHTFNAIKASQYFADFFINESRKNPNRFQSDVEIDQYVIYNFPETFTGLQKSAFEQCYLFDSSVDYPVKKDKQHHQINNIADKRHHQQISVNLV